MDPHEDSFVRAFLVKAYRERCLAKKGLPREDLWHVLASKLDKRYIYWLPDNIHTPKRVAKVLRRLTRVESGYCISGDSTTDGVTVGAGEAGGCEGTIVSFVPGKLAFYQAEYGKNTPMCLLVRSPGLQAKAPEVIKQVGEYYKEHNTDLS